MLREKRRADGDSANCAIEQVAIVGSGPAGLAAAQQLARFGNDVTVLEADAVHDWLVRK